MMQINVHLLALFEPKCAIDVSNKESKVSFIPEIHCFVDTLLRNRFIIVIIITMISTLLSI